MRLHRIKAASADCNTNISFCESLSFTGRGAEVPVLDEKAFIALEVWMCSITFMEWYGWYYDTSSYKSWHFSPRRLQKKISNTLPTGNEKEVWMCSVNSTEMFVMLMALEKKQIWKAGRRFHGNPDSIFSAALSLGWGNIDLMEDVNWKVRVFIKILWAMNIHTNWLNRRVDQHVGSESSSCCTEALFKTSTYSSQSPASRFGCPGGNGSGPYCTWQ